METGVGGTCNVERNCLNFVPSQNSCLFDWVQHNVIKYNYSCQFIDDTVARHFFFERAYHNQSSIIGLLVFQLHTTLFVVAEDPRLFTFFYFSSSFLGIIINHEAWSLERQVYQVAY